MITLNNSFKAMRLLGTAGALTIGALCVSANAADFDDFGKVINVQPQVEQINNPRQECHTEYETVQRYQQRERSNGGAIIGGIAGGLLGSTVGGGNGKVAAAAVGAITGAIAGDRIDNSDNGGTRTTTAETRPVRQCRTIDNWETRTTGYAVTYEYHNRSYTTVLPYDPGSRIRLHVSLTPRP